MSMAELLDTTAFPPFIEEDSECYSIPDYFKLHGFNLYFEDPSHTQQLWVCRGQDVRHLSSSCGGVVKEKIISVLRNFPHYGHEEILFQFWEPVMVRGRYCLTTSDQPSGLSNYHNGLCSYRRHSMRYTIYMDGEKSDEELGLPGRVFRRKLPESTPDVRYYSSKEYPLRDVAVRCGVVGSFAIPIFEPSSGQSCVGVLELVSTVGDVYAEIYNAYLAIEIGGLGSSDYCRIPMHNLGCQKDAGNEIKDVLQVVSKTHKLPLAQAWAPYQHSSGEDNGGNSCNIFDLSCNEEVMTIIAKSYYGASGFMKLNSWQAAPVNFLRKDQGLVGKALLFHKPCFHWDITQLSITEYPFAHHAKMFEIKGCFAVCLLSTSTGNIDCILELFLPPSITENNGDPQTLLGPVVATMKQHFRSFTVVARELGDGLSVEVIEYSTNDELDSSLKICQITSSCPRPEALQTEREAVGDELSVEVIQSFANDEFDSSLKICQPTNSCPRPEALQTERQAVEDDSSHQQSAVDIEDDIQDRRDAGAEQSNIAVTCLYQTCKTKTSNRARKYSITYEEIKQQQDSGVKIDDVAGSLGVGRSTLKRICREFGLEDWRASRTRKKVNCPPSKMKHSTGSVQAGNERTSNSSRRDPSCIERPPKQTLPNVTPMKDVGTVTIKAKYKDITIKFHLSFSCGMAELVENITKRLKVLKDRAFSIKYQDDEGEWILIACEEDLHECMGSSTSLPIRMLIDQPIND